MISIGIDYTPGHWRVCHVEAGRPAEFQVCVTARELQALISQISTLSAELTVVVSLPVATPFGALATLTQQQLEHLAQCAQPPSCSQVREALTALCSLRLRVYCAPSVAYLPTLPAYRRLLRPDLGHASEVCAIVALLHHMREQDAVWPEMNFFFIHADEPGTCVLVIQDGQIVNGIGHVQGSQMQEEAYREGLKQDLAGLLAIHQIEDVVVLGQRSPALVRQLADAYQLYHFPRVGPDGPGYEAALGAALLAEGLEQKGGASGVVDHLQISRAG
jgi:predicted butyrate kinase (DUF1464 family)